MIRFFGRVPGGKKCSGFSGQTQLVTGHVSGADFENLVGLKYRCVPFAVQRFKGQ